MPDRSADDLAPGQLPIYKGGRIVAYAAVDPDDKPLLSRYRWRLHSNGYAERSTRGRGGKVRHIYLHQAVCRIRHPDGRHIDTIDHLNGNKLDCRMRNLEPCSRVENSIRKHNGHRNGKPQPPAWCGCVLEDADLPPF